MVHGSQSRALYLALQLKGRVGVVVGIGEGRGLAPRGIFMRPHASALHLAIELNRSVDPFRIDSIQSILDEHV